MFRHVLLSRASPVSMNSTRKDFVAVGMVLCRVRNWESEPMDCLDLEAGLEAGLDSIVP